MSIWQSGLPEISYYFRDDKTIWVTLKSGVEIQFDAHRGNIAAPFHGVDFSHGKVTEVWHHIGASLYSEVGSNLGYTEIYDTSDPGQYEAAKGDETVIERAQQALEGGFDSIIQWMKEEEQRIEQA